VSGHLTAVRNTALLIIIGLMQWLQLRCNCDATAASLPCDSRSTHGSFTTVGLNCIRVASQFLQAVITEQILLKEGEGHELRQWSCDDRL